MPAALIMQLVIYKNNRKGCSRTGKWRTEARRERHGADETSLRAQAFGTAPLCRLLWLAWCPRYRLDAARMTRVAGGNQTTKGGLLRTFDPFSCGRKSWSWTERVLQKRNYWVTSTVSLQSALDAMVSLLSSLPFGSSGVFYSSCQCLLAPPPAASQIWIQIRQAKIVFHKRKSCVSSEWSEAVHITRNYGQRDKQVVKKSLKAFW